MKVNFKSKTGNKIHVTLSINKETLRKFRFLLPNVNLSKCVEESMLNEIKFYKGEFYNRSNKRTFPKSVLT